MEEKKQDEDQYFEDMAEDYDDLPTINFSNHGLGVPRTRFTETGLWG